MTDRGELAWKLLVELRQEVREAQRIRAQVIGFKIVFVTASLGFVFGPSGPPRLDLLLIPALASVFFDYLITSYGFSIKRIGYYCRHYLEPKIRPHDWPADEPLWEQAMGHKNMRQHFANAGNLGLTLCAVLPAIAYLLSVKPWRASALAAVALGVLVVLDVVFSSFWRYAPRGKLDWSAPGDDYEFPVNPTTKDE